MWSSLSSKRAFKIIKKLHKYLVDISILITEQLSHDQCDLQGHFRAAFHSKTKTEERSTPKLENEAPKVENEAV